MLFRFFLSWCFVCSTTGFSGEVRELWHAGLSNYCCPFSNYKFHSAVVDPDGNIVVGGRSEASGGIFRGFLAKFDSKGAKCWEISLESYPAGGIEALAVDSEDNLIFAVRLDISKPRQVTIIKVSPDGTELWRVVQENVAEGFLSGLSALKTDLQGNIFLNAILVQKVIPGTPTGQQLIAKWDAEGRMLWSKLLPGYGYMATSLGLEKTFALTEKGDVVVVGTFFPNLAGFAAMINSSGCLDWWTDGFKGDVRSAGYDGVLLNGKGMICASVLFGGPDTVFSANGKPLHAIGLGGEVVGIGEEGGFLLKNFSFLRLLGPTGNLRWGMQPFQVLPVWGVVSDPRGGWLAVGRSREWPPGIGFSRIDDKGIESWSSTLVDPLLADSESQLVLQAPDKTMRVVAMNYTGINVKSFLVGDLLKGK